MVPARLVRRAHAAGTVFGSSTVGTVGREASDARARREHDVGPGVTLLVIGAIFTFAIRKELPGIDLQVVGVILMIAGAGLLAHARRGRVRQREVTRVERPHRAEQPTRSVKEQTTEREIG